MATNKTISQRIALQGGQELETLLKRIGKSGEEAFNNIQAAADKVKGPSSEFENRMNRIGASLKAAGTQIGDFGSKMRNIGATMSIVSGAIAGVVLGFGALAKSGSDAAEAAGENAQKTGTTIEEFGRLQFAAEQAGTETESFVGAMGRLSKQLGSAANGSQPALALFEKLGVNIFKSGDQLKTMEEILGDVAQAFANMEDGPEKTARAIEIFGRAGANLLPMLNQGKEGIAELGREAERLGLIFTPEEFAIGDRFNDEVEKMTRAITALKDHVGLIFAPMITEMAIAISDFVATNGPAIRNFIQGVVDGFNALPEPVKIFIGALAGIVIALGPVLLALGLFIQVIGFAVSGLGSLALVIPALVGGIGGLAKAIGALAISPTVAAFGFWAIVIGLVAKAIFDLAQFISAVWPDVVKIIGHGIGQIIEFFQSVGESIVSGFANAFEAVKANFEGMLDYFANWAQSAIDKLRAVYDWAVDVLAKVKEALTAGGDSSPSGGGGGFARGGYVRGPGTSRSDSIIARLSDGEYVVNADAVRKYGVGLLRAINSMKFKGFNAGGLVDSLRDGFSFGSPIPAFATGGMVTAGAKRPINLTIGTETFENLQAPEDVAERLVRFSIGKQIRSTGRKPAWYGA